MHWLRPEANAFGIAELSVVNAHFVPKAEVQVTMKFGNSWLYVLRIFLILGFNHLKRS